jgi:hypothetical protein
MRFCFFNSVAARMFLNSVRMDVRRVQFFSQREVHHGTLHDTPRLRAGGISRPKETPHGETCLHFDYNRARCDMRERTSPTATRRLGS